VNLLTIAISYNFGYNVVDGGSHHGGKMKKFLVLIVSALLLLSGCGSQGDGEPVVTSKAYKVGTGIVTTVATTDATAEALGTVSVNTTYAWIVLDADGVIVYAKIDQVQNNKATFDNTGAVVDQVYKASKAQLMDEYGMVGASPIGKEWYQQIAFMQDWMIGKNINDVLATELADGYATDADLLTGTTISISDFIAAVADANTKLVDVNDIISVGADTYTTASFAAGKIEFDTNSALVALDVDGNVLYTNIDAVQSKIAFDETGVVTAATSNSKKALGDEYGMVGASGIGKEWYQQAAAFETWTVGKSIDAVVTTELADGYATDADLLTGTTIKISDIIASVDAANKAVVTLS